MNLNTFKWQSYKAGINFFVRGIFLIVITTSVVFIRKTGCQDKQQLSGKELAALVDRSSYPPVQLSG